MDNFERELEVAKIACSRMLTREINALKTRLNELDVMPIETKEAKEATDDAVIAIAVAYEGIRNIVCVKEFVEAWKENGDIPQMPDFDKFIQMFKVKSEKREDS